jgi:hypothetical protein
MIEIPEVTDLDIAFGNVEHLPKWDAIPEEFKRGNTKWNRLFNQCFFCGAKGLQLVPKEGVDAKKALRVIRACMGSFEPKHEHKEAGVAYLFSLWFDDFLTPGAGREE